MALTAGPNGTLTLDAVAKTFRYLDPEEAMAQRKALAEKAKKAKGAAK
jgi:type IV pilus assembly protein PilO